MSVNNMPNIEIRKADITTVHADAIVNAANEDLWAGGGVCGAIFRAAGYTDLQDACRRIGHCDTGNAVITPGFHLPARFIIHAVGPVWQGGSRNEAELLYSAYRKSLDLAASAGCQSICFPLISAGIYGYPLEGAWRQALTACADWLDTHKETPIEVIFAVLDHQIMMTGINILMEIRPH